MAFRQIKSQTLADWAVTYCEARHNSSSHKQFITALIGADEFHP